MPPRVRPLRIFPFDPMVDRFGRSVVAHVPYERLRPGPSGRLIDVIDYDGTRRCFYEPVDLDHPDILRNQGIDLAEADPRFHQQMVYAVAMRVLESFERGLARPFRWRGRRRLRIYPHAFEGENAYFDENLFALLFGTFRASTDAPGENLPGQHVFTCLSHDIVAHECAHAVIHRLRPHYSMPTNPDVLGFHEGFADIVALLQRFTYPDVVSEQVARSRDQVGSLESLLGLGAQFNMARGKAGPLRSGLVDPKPGDYLASDEEHDRGAVLSAAVFGGMISSWREAIADLVRLASSGTGVLRPGALHPDLVRRVAEAACTTATRISDICVRAFDYLPPVDITFGDYLRALVTADHQVFPSDDGHLRANLIDQFRVRGIYPTDVTSLSDLSLRIEPVDPGDFEPLPFAPNRLLDAVRDIDRARRGVEVAGDEDADLDGATRARTDDNRDEWASPEQQKAWAQRLHAWATKHRGPLGLDPRATIAVAGFHPSIRQDADGYARTQIALQLVQRGDDADVDLGGVIPLGGATVIADSEGRIRHVVSRPLPTEPNGGLDRLRGFVAAVEHRTPMVAWNEDPVKRITNHLNLRGIDARR